MDYNEGVIISFYNSRYRNVGIESIEHNRWEHFLVKHNIVCDYIGPRNVFVGKARQPALHSTPEHLSSEPTILLT